MASSSGSQTTTNPESDSFSYIETVLESLAVLGKLGSALDIVAQRLSNEIYSLIDSTLDEVSDRAEFGRRNSMTTPSFVAERSEGVYIIPSDPAAFLSGKPQLMSATSLRLAAMESSAQQVDHEIIKDFFWTLFSKMDAVAQSLRVVYEVANRIGSVSTRLHGTDFVSYNSSSSAGISKILQAPNLVHCFLSLTSGS